MPVTLLAQMVTVVNQSTGESGWVTVLIGIGGGLGGAIIGAAATLAASSLRGRQDERAQASSQREAVRKELRDALAAHLGAANQLAGELATLPPSQPSFTDKIFDRLLGERAGFLVSRSLFGRHYDAIVDRFFTADAALRLLAPIEVLAHMNDVERLLAQWDDDGNPSHEQEWADLRDRLQLVYQRTTDEGRGRPYRAGEEPLGGGSSNTVATPWSDNNELHRVDALARTLLPTGLAASALAFTLVATVDLEQGDKVALVSGGIGAIIATLLSAASVDLAPSSPQRRLVGLLGRGASSPVTRAKRRLARVSLWLLAVSIEVSALALFVIPRL